MRKIIRYNILVSILLFSISFWGHSQHAVSGFVIKEQAKTPLEFATAVLYTADSVLFKGSVTDGKGIFRFDAVRDGYYTLEVRLIGYQTIRQLVDVSGADRDGGTIVLQETGVGLNEVTVTATAPPVLQKSDRMIVRPEFYMLTAGKNAADVIRELPGVIAESGGGLSVVGKPAIVYINGKPADLTGTAVDRLLKALQAERIERVELITNPPSRYEAAHSGVIIDIRLRRDESEGYNGTAAMTSYLKTTGLAFTPTLNANYRTGKLNVYGNYGLNNGRYEQQFHDVNRYHSLAVPLEYTEHGVYRPSGTSHDGSLGIDWLPSVRHTIGFLVKAQRYDGGNTNRSTTDIRRIGSAQVDSGIISPLTMDIASNFFSLDLNHVWTWGKDASLTTDAVYSYADHRQEQQMRLNYVDATGQKLRPHDGRGHGVRQKTNVWMLKTDYERRLPADIRLETGAQLSHIWRDNNLTGLTLSKTDEWNENLAQSNHFIYKEQIAGLYFNLSRQWDQRFSLSAGLRAEHTFQDGYQAVGDTGFIRHRLDLFPSLSMQYSVNQRQSFSFSYARKVDRPSFSNLNPFRFFTSPNTYREGNPDLSPSYRHSLQLNYRLHGYNLSLSYTHTDRMIIEEPSQDDATRKQSFVYMNFGQSDLYSLSLNLPFRIYSRWSMNVNANGFCRSYRSRFMGNDFRKTFFYANARLSNRFDWGRGWRMQLNSFVVTPMWYLTRRFKTRGSTDLAIEKSLWNNRSTLTITLNDPFRWNQSRSTLRYGNIDTESLAIPDYRSIRLDFTYRLGSDKVKQSRQRRTGAESINSRL